MLFKRFFSKQTEDSLITKPGRNSYSQSGEDMVSAFALEVLGVKNPIYLDIGCFDAVKFSNTFYFYENGGRGVCVEANPHLASEFARLRSRDNVVNVGLSGSYSGSMPFYVMEQETLSTFSKSEAERLANEESATVKDIVEVNVLAVSEFLNKYFPDRRLDFVSIDVEGFDFEIVSNFDFNFVRPLVFCVETLEYKQRGVQQKNSQLIDFMLAQGYMLYADTFINSIFVDRAAWDSR